MDAMTAPAQPASTLTLDVRVDQYIRLRDKIKEIKDRHKQELKTYNETLEILSGIILKLLDQAGSESSRTSAGTAYKTLKKTATIADKAVFWAYVQNHGAWDLLDYKANVKAVSDFISDLTEDAKSDPTVIPAPPPGVNYSEAWEVGVRRKSK